MPHPIKINMYLFFNSQMILQNVDKAQVKLLTKKDNVAGVTLPIFETTVVGTSSEYEFA